MSDGQGREFSIEYYDKEGNFLGYYAEDSHSGGYPYIATSTRQAEVMTEAKAIKTAEDSFNFPYSNFDEVDTCVVGKFILSEHTVLLRSTFKDQKKAREIAERREQIERLQREIEMIQEGAQ